jgi:(S)-ureidoglycine aminohydrolase
MHKLGHTRSVSRRDHLLHTPDTFIRTPLPALTGGAAIVHIGPAAGADFTQYTIEMETGGVLKSGFESDGGVQRFVYVLEGELTLNIPGRSETLSPRAYAYLPASLAHELTASAPACAAIIERAPAAAEAPLLIAHEDAVAPAPLAGDPDLLVRALLPDHPARNFAVNTMTYQPGAALSMVEVHVMEHGLLMLEGGGIYRLGDQWYPVAAGDFIWMGPFCPQWFGALGKQPAKYLIYKDWNEHPLETL